MRKVTVRLTRSPVDELIVGQLAEHHRRVYFEFEPSFIRTGIELSPFKLRLQNGLIEHGDRRFGPLPGLFDDSLPDGWGLLLMDRHFRSQGIDPATLSVVDRLAYIGTRTMGALTYHPPAESEHAIESLDLVALARNAERVFAGDSIEVLPQLLRTGGSPGGARPKVLVGVQDSTLISGEGDLPDGYEHWIIKLAARTDVRDAGPVEQAYALMATEAGIEMPPTRLFDASATRRYFGVRRFDRLPGNRRVHVHTFANMMQVDFRIPSLDYADLLKVTRILTRDQTEVVRLFRRMVFNVVAHVRDDHGKNFAFVLDPEHGWRLSPAYDLTFAPGPGGEHTTTVAGESRRPTREHAHRVAVAHGVRTSAERQVYDEVNSVVDRWKDFADRSGCTKRIAAEIGRSLTRM